MKAAFEEGSVAGASIFPQTRYFEVKSERAGARYAIWVTVPSAYAREPDRFFPAIYSPDGNRNMAFATGLCDLAEWDLMDSFQPTIQICIGYPDEDAGRALAVRARDLLPPNEPLPDGQIESIRNGSVSGILDRGGADLYIRNLENPAGDRFLAFVTEELHPFLLANFRIDPDKLGLFGHSYGGLFAAYAALQPRTIFRNICASSPGILPQKSSIFALYADTLKQGGVSERSLHVTVATREIRDPGIYQTMVGGGTVELLQLAGVTPLKGLTVTSRFYEEQTHITVKADAMHSFLRTFYLKDAAAGTGDHASDTGQPHRSTRDDRGKI